MKIILVIADEKGRNSVFVTDDLRVYSLKKAVQLAKEKKFSGVYPVQRRSGAYLRTSRPYIYIGTIAHLSKKTARKRLKEYQTLIFEAAKRFEVDPYLLGAIIIDELARFVSFEDVLEKLTVFHMEKDVSAGIAQVKIETARGLIKDGYFNPDPKDPRLSPEKVEKTLRKDLYEYVKQPKYNIFFAAAHMRALIDRWKEFVDLRERPEIIATLYSIGRGKPPHGSPQPSKRGLQISGEFYKLSREWFS